MNDYRKKRNRSFVWGHFIAGSGLRMAIFLAPRVPGNTVSRIRRLATASRASCCKAVVTERTTERERGIRKAPLGVIEGGGGADYHEKGHRCYHLEEEEAKADE
ncbi:hypothetical protein GW17_00055170 [Ensete ventricosum]|nr:hypothetical protein GW17_00055170 [Ensete ventricosum]